LIKTESHMKMCSGGGVWVCSSIKTEGHIILRGSDGGGSGALLMCLGRVYFSAISFHVHLCASTCRS
jgi:uncharacterized protein (UPF0371 family)